MDDSSNLIAQRQRAQILQPHVLSIRPNGHAMFQHDSARAHTATDFLYDYATAGKTLTWVAFP